MAGAQNQGQDAGNVLAVRKAVLIWSYSRGKGVGLQPRKEGGVAKQPLTYGSAVVWMGCGASDSCLADWLADGGYEIDLLGCT